MRRGGVLGDVVEQGLAIAERRVLSLVCRCLCRGREVGIKRDVNVDVRRAVCCGAGSGDLVRDA